jgi:hypothetical protein
MFFPNVNFLRAAAALLVLVYHVVELGPWPAFPTHGVFLLFRMGWIGVDLFFVISGFVIGLSAIRLYRDGDRSYRWTFMRRRLARIVPLYLVTASRSSFWSGRRSCSCRGEGRRSDRKPLSSSCTTFTVAARLDQRRELERGGGNAVLRARDRGGPPCRG